MDEAPLKSLPQNPALIQLQTLVALAYRIMIDEQGHTGFIQHLHSRHVNTLRACIVDVEREEVHVVAHAHGVAVVFRVSANDEMLAGVEQRPRRYGKADPANVEIRESRAL